MGRIALFLSVCLLLLLLVVVVVFGLFLLVCYFLFVCLSVCFALSFFFVGENSTTVFGWSLLSNEPAIT